MEEAILVTRKGNWATVTLNRPKALNSLNEPMLKLLGSAIKDLAEDTTCRAILLTGAGRGFCAGQDLAELREGGDIAAFNLAGLMDREYHPTLRLIRSMEKPVVCAVNGVAAGGGANLALACDIVLAAKSAQFIQGFARIGLIPDCGGTFVLPRLIGDARARALSMLTDPVKAEQAEAWGMIWQAVEDDALMTEAQALTERLANQPTKAMGFIKQAYLASTDGDFSSHLDVERDLQHMATQTSDYIEGVTAFFEKRPPAFKGQ
ncbi:enoyl-CoA hydratase-related protein [Sphingobium sp. YR768]|uniref:enoyl-CoA hydratase-related protein n=1 Tax=Sphingobium sp. YR768 TaxID=1884365 RepID=UPI0008B987FC|nr:enoyl-CoA hydratase-related protein [Sphingobium sp. YR768]SES12680.1 2-(1,2-epoxy-1,2-dihydrophenyl)acetyl-CoA isomerase [Sphingobium sp. YR768]